MKATSYIEFTKNISYKRERLKYKEPNEESVERTIQALKSVLPAIPKVKQVFDSCESAADFFKAFPTFKQIGCNSEEAFYRFKLGFKIDGVPSRAVYIIKKAIGINGTEFPNLTIQSVYKLLEQYDDFYFINSGNEVTLIDVIEYILAKPVKLTTARRPRVDNEVYIKNVDRIAIIPDDILEEVEGEISYDAKRGLIGNVHGVETELRILSNRIGVTTDDFDLRKAF